MTPSGIVWGGKFEIACREKYSISSAALPVTEGEKVTIAIVANGA
jgi:hypothetical protein